jgi:signal transduction histidine kinase
VNAPLRHRLTLFVGGTTALVILALVIPFGFGLRKMTEERTIANVTAEAQRVAQAAAASPEDDADQLDLVDLGTTRFDGTSVILPDDKVIGAAGAPQSAIDRARDGVSFVEWQQGNAVVYAGAFVRNRGTVVTRMVVPPGELHRGVAGATAELVLLGLLLLSITVGATYVLAGRLIVDPIERLVEAANALQDGRLETRAPETGPLEITALAQSLNRLARKIKDLLALERESVADLSHRLRTPVTALRLDADSIADPEVAERFRSHVDHLERTVDAVVREARLPPGPSVSPQCDVAQVVDERVAFWSALAEEQGRRLRVHLPKGPAWGRIDTHDLTAVVDVLIDNVFAHTDEGVPLEVSVMITPQRFVALLVEDGGPGLPSADVVTRGRSGGGSSGLGLDIVRRAAIAAGGALELGRSRFGGAAVGVLFAPAEDPERRKPSVSERLRRDRKRGRRRRPRTVLPAIRKYPASSSG